MKFKSFVVWTGIVGLACVATRTWGFQDPSAPVGLKGIVTGASPENLNDEYFSGLVTNIDDSWKDWSRETAALVKEFYEGANPTIQDQAQALAKLRSKLATMEKAMGNSAYQSIYPQLSTLYGRLAPQVDIAEAMLATLTADPQAAAQSRLEPALQRLHTGLQRVRNDLKGFRGGEQWLAWARIPELEGLRPDHPDLESVVASVKHKLDQRETYTADVRDFVSRPSMLALEDSLAGVLAAINPAVIATPDQVRSSLVSMMEAMEEYRSNPSAAREANIRRQLDAFRTSAPDGGSALGDALFAQYANYNLRMQVSEGLANRFYTERRRETSSINDQVMEAWVSGCQTTDIVSRMDLLPSENNALFAIRLTGNVSTNTNGYTSQATIHTVGHHRFTAAKAVVFDGHVFHQRPARVEVLANNQTVGASTKFSKIPLLGRIADNIAFKEASKRTGQANGIARRKIAEQVGVELDREANTEFGNASRALEANTYGPLRKYALYPDVMKLSSTDTVLGLSSRLMDGTEVGGSRPVPMGPVPANGLVAQIHESLLTNGIDSIGLQGRMTEPEVKALFESRLSEILSKPVHLPKDPNAPPSDTENVFVFDAEEPVRFTIDNGIVTLHIKAGLERANGENIPPQVISVPLALSLRGDKIHIERGDNVRVTPVERAADARTQIVRAQVMRQKIQTSIPEQNVDAVFDIENQGKMVHLKITNLTANAGWLTVTME